MVSIEEEVVDITTTIATTTTQDVVGRCAGK